MTLVVALRGTDGLVLAADSRGTYGDPRGVTAQNDSMIKLNQLARHAGVLTSGNAGSANELLAAWPEDRASAIGVAELVETFSAYVRQKYNEWFASFPVREIPNSPMPMRPILGFTIGGYEYADDERTSCSTTALYGLTSMLNFAPMRLDHGFAVDGVAQYSLYLLNRLYRGTHTAQQLKNLASYVITETASQDGKVGGPVQLATITPKDGYVQVPEDQVDEILTDNEGRSEALRKSFFGETDGRRRPATRATRK